MAQDFNTQYKILKTNENWDEIIQLGLEVLKIEDNGLIRLRLSSCYFYLGNYQEALSHAQLGEELTLDQPNLLAKSYYLISACFRALCLKSSDEASRVGLSSKAHRAIEEAVKLTEKITPFIKAKIYFNYGALVQDVDNAPEKAGLYLSKAMEIFRSSDNYRDDYNRAAMRYIRAILEQGKIEIAEKEVTTLEPFIPLDSKSGVHFLQLKAKIFCALNKYDEAYHCAKTALDKAVEKNMLQDAARLKELLEAKIIPFCRSETISSKAATLSKRKSESIERT